MGNTYVTNASVYLIDALFGLYMLLVLLRFLLQTVRADFYNPICQFLVKVTNPPLRPLRRVIPGFGGIDLASIVLLLALQGIALSLSFLAVGRPLAPGAILTLSVAELLSLTLSCFQITILAQVILSWVGPGTYNPLTALLYSLNAPLLRPAQRLLPAVHGFDFSPILVLIAIQLIKILVVMPISDIGRHMG